MAQAINSFYFLLNLETFKKGKYVAANRPPRNVIARLQLGGALERDHRKAMPSSSHLVMSWGIFTLGSKPTCVSLQGSCHLYWQA